jgi:hypothetical protein
VILLIILASFGGYSLGFANRATSTVTSNGEVTSTATVVTTSTTLVSSTVTGYTQTLNYNNSISSITADNMTIGRSPTRIGVNPMRDILYIPYYNGNNTSIAVVNGSTNQMVTTIPGLSGGDTFVLVDSRTNMVYYASQVINGTTNHLSATINSTMTFVAIDQASNLLFATSSNSGPGSTMSSTLYEINGTNNAMIDSINIAGAVQNGEGAVGEVALNSVTHTLYFPSCMASFTCYPTDIYAINEQGLQIKAQIEINEYAVFAIVVDQATNTIFATASQNKLLVINGTTNQVTRTIPISAYANQLRNMEIDQTSGELFITGSPVCGSGLPDCGVDTLYVMSTQNYGLFAFFSMGNNTGGQPVYLTFDPANNETYMSLTYFDYVLAVKIPHYQVSILLP